MVCNSEMAYQSSLNFIRLLRVENDSKQSDEIQATLIRAVFTPNEHFSRRCPPPRPKVEKPIHKGGGNGLLVPSLSLPPSVTPRVCLLGHI